MKKDSGLRAFLGIKQKDMAMLLNVSRGHWAMFELGKRDLPLPAKQTLAAILTHISAADKLGTNKTDSAKHETTRQNLLERLLRENQRQQYLIAKKVTALSKKHEADARMLQLGVHVKSLPGSKTDIDASFVKFIAAKTSQLTSDRLWAELTRQQLRQEVLVLEQQLLASKLKTASEPLNGDSN